MLVCVSAIPRLTCSQYTEAFDVSSVIVACLQNRKWNELNYVPTKYIDSGLYKLVLKENLYTTPDQILIVG